MIIKKAASGRGQLVSRFDSCEHKFSQLSLLQPGLMDKGSLIAYHHLFNCEFNIEPGDNYFSVKTMPPNLSGKTRFSLKGIEQQFHICLF